MSPVGEQKEMEDQVKPCQADAAIAQSIVTERRADCAGVEARAAKKRQR